MLRRLCTLTIRLFLLPAFVLVLLPAIVQTSGASPGVYAQDVPAGGNAEQSTNQPDQAMLDAAKEAFAVWADAAGEPYRELAIEVLENDGYFSLLDVRAQFRSSRQAPWMLHRFAVECRLVGSNWRCDAPTSVPFAYWLGVRGGTNMDVVGVWPDGAQEQVAEVVGSAVRASADGNYLAYEPAPRMNPYRTDLTVTRADGSQAQRLSDSASVWWRANMWAWSPTAPVLAFTGYPSPESASDEWADALSYLYLWDVAKDTLHKVLESEADLTQPFWSTDGDMLLVSEAVSSTETTPIYAELLFIDVAAREVTERIPVTEQVWPAAWSSATGRVLLQSHRGRVFLMDALSGEMLDLCPRNNCGYPALSPDGARVAFAVTDGGDQENPADDRFNLAIVDLDEIEAAGEGADVESFRREVLPASYPLAALWDRLHSLRRPPIWSPDGEYLYLQTFLWSSDQIVRLADGKMWLGGDQGTDATQFMRWDPAMTGMDLPETDRSPCPPADDRSVASPDAARSSALLYLRTPWTGVLLDPDGACRVLPINLEGNAQQLSPKGDHIASIIYNRPDETLTLVVTDLAHGVSTVVAELETKTYQMDPSGLRMLDWSPDGMRLAYAWPQSDTEQQIFVYDLAAQESTLISPEGDFFLDPRWSHNGRYLSYCTPAPARSYGPGKLLVADLQADADVDDAGKSAVVNTWTLTPQIGEIQCRDIDWSPTADALAASITSNADGDPYLVGLVGVDGSTQPLIPEGKYPYGLSYAPDGQRIAYVRIKPDSSDPELVVADAASGEVLVALQLPGGTQPWATPQWSPDGEYLALSSLTGQVPYLLRLADLTLWRAPLAALVKGVASWLPGADDPELPGTWVREAITNTLSGLAQVASGDDPENSPESAADAESADDAGDTGSSFAPGMSGASDDSATTWADPAFGRSQPLVDMHPEWKSYTHGNQINDILVQDGYLWLATTGGILRRDIVTDEELRFTTEHGLPGNHAIAAASAPDGSLWFGLGDGLVRIAAVDPQTSTVVSYTMTSYDQRDGLINSDSWAVYAAPDGTIWAGGSGGVTHLDASGVIATYGPGQGLTDGLITAIGQGPDGAMWFAGYNGGVTRMDANGSVTRYEQGDELAGNRVWDMEVTGDAIWFATGPWSSEDGGVSRLAPDGTWKSFKIGDGLPGEAVLALLVTADGRLVAGTEGGAAYMTAASLTAETPAKPAWIYWEEAPYYVLDVEESDDGSLYFVTFGEVWRIAPEGTRTVYAIRNELAHSAAVGAVADAAGNIWIGTAEGVNRVTPDGAWSTFEPVNDVISVSRDPVSGNPWFTSYQGVATVSSGGRWAVVEGGKQTYMGTPTVAQPVGQAELWIGSSEGLFLLRDGKLESSYTAANSDLPASDITALLYVPETDLWVGTRAGAVRARQGAGQVVFGTDDGLPSGVVTSFAVARDGAVWIGTEGGPVLLSADDEWITPEAAREIRQPVRAIFAASDGAWWFATDGGAFRLDSGGTMQVFTAESGLPANTVTGIAEDPAGRIWVTTRGGVGVYTQVD